MKRLLLVAVVLVGGCSTTSLPGPTDRPTATPEPTPDPYEQTWTTPYGDTTCLQWRAEMSEHERFVAAGDMLVGAWDNGQVPDDALIRSFEAAIGTACSPEAEQLEIKIAEVAAILYVEAADFKPR